MGIQLILTFISSVINTNSVSAPGKVLGQAAVCHRVRVLLLPGRDGCTD